jgi:large subunit ribosomal protein L4
VVVVDVMKLDGSKTSAMANILHALGAGRSALVLLPESNEAVQKSVRNMEGAKTLHARYLNVRDLLGYDTLVLPLAALDVIKSYLGLEGAK